MASFSIPLTGLDADSTALNTIANDLSNMNTTGFKAQTVNFSDLFYQQVGSAGSGDPIQVGSGTQVASIETDFSNGSPNSTGVDTDVALQGSGFFVVSDGSSQFLTRAGNFSTDSSGNLITANGLNVMGYPAVNGVVNTNATLTPINIPEGQIEAPKATTNFGMTAVLDSSAAVGNSISGFAPVYDSLGNAYQATVTYTKTGTNAWSYNVTLPNTLTAATSATANVTTTNYTFASNGGNVATVDPATSMTITGPNSSGVSTTIPAPAVTPGETLATYAAALQNALTAANISGTVTATTGGQLSVAGVGVTTAGNVLQDPVPSTLTSSTATAAGVTTINYNFASSGGTLATVDPGTNLTITGLNSGGVSTTIPAPTVTAGETVAAYATALQNALTTANFPATTTVTATAGGQLTITGAAGITTSGNVIQDPPAAKLTPGSNTGSDETIAYNFGSSGGALATVDAGTNLTITGPNTNGVSTTISAPPVTAGETVATYASSLQNALSAAGFPASTTVTASASGQLTITGVGVTTTGSVIQDPVASANTTGSLAFDANGNLVSPATNLTGITFAGLSDGAATMNMTWDMFGASGKGNISQVDATSSISNYTGDGYASGTYSGFTIGSDGTVTASFSNGQTLNVGQLALGDVANLQGLADMGNGDYQTTLASGTTSIGTSGTAGLGTMEDGALEASNVNISAEFSDLIIAQRAFEANSKAVTTFDTITQETINMIH